jgi:tRNA A37 threonylcarbamoyladenosine synthetase subunit TsaC/SUA5/YrdC
VWLSDIEDIYIWTDVTVAREVIEDLLPGQATLVFRRSDLLNNNFNPDTELVWFRIHEYPFMREGCGMSLGPLTLTSTNYSGNTSTLQVEEFAPLHDSLHTVFHARLGSTMMDIFTIIRPGPGSVREKAE